MITRYRLYDCVNSSGVEFELPMLEGGVRVPVHAIKSNIYFFFPLLAPLPYKGTLTRIGKSFYCLQTPSDNPYIFLVFSNRTIWHHHPHTQNPKPLSAHGASRTSSPGQIARIGFLPPPPLLSSTPKKKFFYNDPFSFHLLPLHFSPPSLFLSARLPHGFLTLVYTRLAYKKNRKYTQTCLLSAPLP